MFPAADFFDDGIGVGGPDEWFGTGIGLLQEAVDGGLEIDDAFEDTPRLSRRRVSLAKKPATALSQEAKVGVKWK